MYRVVVKSDSPWYSKRIYESRFLSFALLRAQDHDGNAARKNETTYIHDENDNMVWNSDIGFLVNEE